MRDADFRFFPFWKTLNLSDSRFLYCSYRSEPSGRRAIFPKLEGKAIVAWNFLEISAVCAVICGIAVSGGSVALISRSFALIILSRRSAEAYIICNYLCGISLLTVVVSPISSLDATAYDDAGALLKVTGNKLRLLTPCNDVDEVYIALTLVLFGIAAVNANREAANGCTACCLLQLGISRHMTHKYNLI